MSNEQSDTSIAPVADTTELKTEQTKTPELEAFARKEKQLRKMQADLAAEKQALQAKLSQYETDYVPKSRLKEDPWSVLNESGLDYDTLTQQMLEQPQDPATKSLMAKLKAMEAKINAQEQKAQESTQAQYQQALKQIGNEVKMLIDAEAEFETIKMYGDEGVQAVVDLIESDFEQTGTVKDVKEACAEIENYLLEQALKAAQLKKVQEKLKPKVEETAVTTNATKQTQTNGIKTLTNSMQTQPSKRMSEKEKRDRAIAAFHGKLNQ